MAIINGTSAAGILNGTASADTINGLGGDDTLAGGVIDAGFGWAQIGNVAIGAQTYVQYTQGGALLQVDTDINSSALVEPTVFVHLAALDGINGFQMTGEAVVDTSGWSVSSAGDVNGDGFSDLIIGAPSADPNGSGSGASYVVFGRASGFGANLNLSAFNGTNGFKVSGEASPDVNGDHSGMSVSTAGDVNGDGFDDLIIGAPYADPNGHDSGASYVVLGHAGGFGANLDLSALNGANGFQISGETADDVLGWSVSSASDVNGDGLDDLIVGANRADPNGSQSGASYVVFGQVGGFGANLELSALNGVNGFQISGEALDDISGWSVSTAGDMNQDGFDDLIIGAIGADPNGFEYGASYVVFGRVSGFSANLNLSALNGTNGFQISGENLGQSGRSVSSAGDVNGDGFDDVIVGAGGASHVVFGKASGFVPALNLSALDGNNGFRISGNSGRSVSAGDVNGDGFDDLIVGNQYASPSGTFSGESYVITGQVGGFDANINVSALDGANGFRIIGEAAQDKSGFSVSSAGDVNHDGFDDVIIGAYGADLNGDRSGASYVVFGRDFPNREVLLGTDGDDALSGTGAKEVLIGGLGNDTLTGAGGADKLIGGAGNDLYIVSAALDQVVEAGAQGTDTVNATVAHTLAANVEKLVQGGAANIAGTGNTLNNTLTGNTGANNLKGLGGADTISGLGGNDTLDGGTGTDSMKGGAGDDIYIADAAADKAIELAAQGSDTVRSSAPTFTLGVNVEKLILAGAANISGTGNALNNTLTGNLGANQLIGLGGNDTLVGNGGNDSLDGGTGNDSMAGGAGNDLYFVNAALDKVVELAAQGSDTVNATVTHTLALNVEKLIQGGVANIAGTGNTLNNTLTGNGGANNLSGLGGADTVNGGAGADTLEGGTGVDSLVGGAGNDTLIWDVLDVKVDGGADSDTLRVTGSTALNLTAVSDTKIVDVEVVNLAGTNTLTLNASDVLAISTTTDTLRVIGGAGDAVNAGPGWTQIANTVVGGRAYAQYTRDGATLQVDTDIDRSGIVVAALDLSALDGMSGFQLTGEADGDFAGWSVASAGDVNGDGFDDLLVGADHYGASDNGAAYVVFGKASGFASNLALAALDGTSGFQITGEALGDYSGRSVSAAGDVNGDGFDDLLIGADGADPHGIFSGTTYVVFGAASGFASNLALSALDGANGFQLSGEAELDNSGISVSTAGDVNGDGFADLVIGAFGADPHGSFSGAAYVVFGHASGFGSNLDLSALDGANGFQLSGEAANDSSGWSVSAAGDVNGDGFADLVIGAYGADPHGSLSGAAYVVFGHASGFGSNLELSALDGANGFKLSGEALGDQSGRSVSTAGDVNGDGFADLVIGVDRADPHGLQSGASYVVFGHASGFGSNLDLSALDGANGFQLSGEAAGDYSGCSVAAAGDVNGDGFADLVIGAFGASPYGGLYGATYVVFGHASGFNSNLDLSALDGVNGFQLSGEAIVDQSGYSVAAAGDVNGDGFADLLIGAFGAEPNGDYSGASYVVYGRDWNGVVDFLGTADADTLPGTGAAEVFVAGRGNDTMAGGGGADVFRGGEGDDLFQVSDALFLDVDGGSGTDTLALTGDGVTLDLTLIANSKVTGIETIDLVATEDANSTNTLTLALGDVLDLSDTSNTLTIDGDGDDTVTVTDGAWAAGAPAGGYNIYTFGAATLRIDADIVNVTITPDT